MRKKTLSNQLSAIIYHSISYLRFCTILLITITITNRQKTLRVDRRRMRQAICAILRDAEIMDARVGIALVDDPAIAKLHAEFLDDPEPTDVLSFVLEQSEGVLEGEVVASADTAAANARRYRCTPDEELLRYVIHGTLHLVGYDDVTPPKRAVMRKKEREYIGQTIQVSKRRG